MNAFASDKESANHVSEIMLNNNYVIAFACNVLIIIKIQHYLYLLY